MGISRNIYLMMLFAVQVALLMYTLFFMRVRADEAVLANWVNKVKPVLYNQTILDLTWPGSHDSLTSDLSTTFSGHANDVPPALAWLLHTFGSIIPTVGAFGRSQAKTQGLSITQQLNSGIRFIDFRIQYTGAKPFSKDAAFYCLHFMQSNKPAIEYLKEAKIWLDQHPNEIVIFWISKHGSECGPQEYAATVSQRQAWWAEVESLFGEKLLNRVQTPINETSIGYLIDNTKSRVVMYVADYMNMTSESKLATDSCYIDNRLDGGVTDEANAYHSQINQFNNSKSDKIISKKNNKFLLVSMATSADASLIKNSFFIHYFKSKKALKNCAKYLNLPNVTEYCTTKLQDLSQLSNYYNQISLEYAHIKGYEFPNAIYIGAIDLNGTIRTGTDDFLNLNDSSYETQKYAYVSTLLLGNLRRADCSKYAAECDKLISMLDINRKAYPMTTWEDLSHGRLVDWPK